MRIGGIKSSAFYEVSAMRKTTAATCLTFLAVLGFGPCALAQNTNSGEIRGVVTDQSGAIMPGVVITILNTDTGVSRNLTTNESGVYDAVSIIPGNYRLTFARDGFDKLIRSGVE